MEGSSFSDHSTKKNQIKPKLLRRTLTLRAEQPVVKLGVYTKMKGVYYKKIDESIYNRSLKRFFYTTGKPVKYVTSLDLTLYGEPYGRELVKLLKNLKNINIKLIYGCPSSFRSCIQVTRQLPKDTESFNISGTYIETNETEIQSLFRNLSICRKLERLEESLHFEQALSLAEVKYNAINKHIPRLRSLKALGCEEIDEDDQGLQEYLSRGQACPYVTDLSFTLSENMVAPGNPDNESKIPLLFRFDLFPSLQQLKIRRGRRGMSLSPSVSQGFKSLSQLKSFILDFQTFTFGAEIQGRKFLFEGLRYLPMLDHFSLASSSDIENEEELLLVEFLQKQKHLVSLSILFRCSSMPSRSKYEELNQHLEMICQAINNRPKLKYLYLDATAWSLQALSRGLSQVGTTNQLKELTIGVFDDLSIHSSNPQDKAKGVCDFIKRQKQSLSSVKISLECIKEDEVIDSLIQAIGEAHNLESFDLEVNMILKDNSFENNTLLQDIPKESMKEYPPFKKTFTYLNQVLPQLKGLSDLSLRFYPIVLPYEAPLINSSIIFNSVTALKNLKHLSLFVPFINESITEHPAHIHLLYKIETLMSLIIVSSNYDVLCAQPRNEEINKIFEITSQKMYTRHNLKF